MMAHSRVPIITAILIAILAARPGSDGQASARTAPVAVGGVLDLQQWDVRRDGIAALAGQHES
jgi:hypothetical protein